MVVWNDLDRFHLAQDVIDRVPKLNKIGAYAKQHIRNKLIEPKPYTTTYGKDMPEVENWPWQAYSGAAKTTTPIEASAVFQGGSAPSQQGGEGTASSRPNLYTIALE